MPKLFLKQRSLNYYFHKKFHNLFSEENDIQFLKDENINKKYYAQERSQTR